MVSTLTGLNGDEYTLGTRVHLNGFGDAVYQGTKADGTAVAIKAVRNGKSTDDVDAWLAEASHIEREWEVSEKLRQYKHNHLLLIDDRCSDPTTTGDMTYYVMPWADRSLTKMLKSVSDGDILDIISQLAAGLGELSAAAVVHRDVKPSNVLWWEDKWRLADFGASSLDDRQRTHTFRGSGTTFFRAPEVLRGAEETPLSDIYSLGCLGYALRTGKPPFQDGTNSGWRDTLLSRPPGIDDLNPVLEILLGRMLAKNPQLRPQSAAEVIVLCERRSNSTSALVERATVLKLAHARKQLERDATAAAVEYRTQLTASALADLDQVLDDMATAFPGGPEDVRYDKDIELSAWTVKFLGHRLTVAIVEGFDQADDPIRVAMVEITDDDGTSPILVGNLVCEEHDGANTWSLVRFTGNSAAPVSERLGVPDRSAGLRGSDLRTAWRRRNDPVPPAVHHALVLTTDTLPELLISHMEATSTPTERKGSDPPVSELTVARSTKSFAAQDSARYEDRIAAELDVFEYDEMVRNPDRNGPDFRVNTPMGTAYIEAKYRTSDRFELADLYRVVNPIRRSTSAHGVVVVTNVRLSAAVREVNQRGSLDGIPVEALTWGSPADSSLLARAVARALRWSVEPGRDT